MIEAVKSTIAAMISIKPRLDQMSNARSFASNPDKIQEVAAEAPYVSPSIRVDNHAKIAILEFRDSMSGDVLAQIPSEAQLEAYKRRQIRDDDTGIPVKTTGDNRKPEQSGNYDNSTGMAIAKTGIRPSGMGANPEARIFV